ncbi:MAG: LacI family transcriptional regulator [Kosmotoga sp.]|nr:MAG: LacI family transcriptional regulator [Kosmotoga sp.]
MSEKVIPQKLTIADIAKMANVSKATVSYVINNKEGVSLDVRNKIKQIIKESNYKPNTMARALAGKRTNSVGLIIPDISDMFYANIIRGVEKASGKFGYFLNLFTTHADPEKEHEVFDFLTSSIADGVIVMTYFVGKEVTRKLKQRKIPFVFLDFPYDDDIYSVSVDNFEGGYKATSYLTALGHRKIAFIHGPEAARDSKARYHGYLKALREHNIPYNNDLVLKGDFLRQGGYKAAKSLIKNNKVPTALFAANDQMALGAMTAFKKEGYRIPEDISIIGFDNTEASTFSKPTLTTIMQPIFEMGSLAAKTLISLINGKTPEMKRYLLKTRLIERHSCSYCNNR